ncbi:MULTISPECIES: hypothetical protein [unclassified Streptomyces]|uniref:hypothetical protein n=1 Tax=unclassified Streptomyces TaxID=2593676 RepID=UPI0037F40213
MSETTQMTGGPLDGQTVELHPVQQQNPARTGRPSTVSPNPSPAGVSRSSSLHDETDALGHGPRTSAERERDLAQMLAPYTREDMLVAAICETDWDPDRWYPSVETREKAEAEDGKWPSKQALARLAATSQYIKQAPPPVPTHTREGKPYNEKYRAKKVASRQSGLDSSTANVLREILSGVGATDHRRSHSSEGTTAASGMANRSARKG